jgi:hypothetical protein
VRQNANLLSDLLNEAIGYLDGEDAAKLVATARKRRLAGGPPTARPRVLDRLFADLSSDQAIFLARALASHSMLANIGEDVAGRRRHAEADAGSGRRAAPHPGRRRQGAGRRGQVAGRADQGPGRHERGAGADRPPDRGAPPQHGRPRDRDLAPDGPAPPPPAAAMDAEIRERLFREIALMWRTRLYRPERITVKDEIRNALSIVRTSILPAVIDLYADWSQQIGEHGQMAPLLKMGSWLGGDRDGHPGVNGDTLKLALASQARVILDWYAAEVRKLWSNLAVSTAYAPVSEELLALAGQPGTRPSTAWTSPIAWPGADLRPSVGGVAEADQPVGGLRHRPTDVEPYGHPAAFVADLKIIIDSLERHGGERLVGSALRTLVEVAQACGFHLMSLDLRQNADVHERTLHELFQRAGERDREVPGARRGGPVQAADQRAVAPAAAGLAVHRLWRGDHQGAGDHGGRRPDGPRLRPRLHRRLCDLQVRDPVGHPRAAGPAQAGRPGLGRSGAARLGQDQPAVRDHRRPGERSPRAAPVAGAAAFPHHPGRPAGAGNHARLLRQQQGRRLCRLAPGVAKGASALAFEAERMGVGLQLFHGRGGRSGGAGGRPPRPSWPSRPAPCRAASA